MGNGYVSVRSLQPRHVVSQAVTLGRYIGLVIILWKVLILVTGSEAPVVVVLSGSMEPGFKKGDILFLHMNKDPIRAGDIVVFRIEGRPIPIVHRVIKVHQRQTSRGIEILTKGDNNPIDDRGLYAYGQHWLHQHQIIGRAVGFVPYLGWLSIIMTETPAVKFGFFGILGLLAIILE